MVIQVFAPNDPQNRPVPVDRILTSGAIEELYKVLRVHKANKLLVRLTETSDLVVIDDTGV